MLDNKLPGGQCGLGELLDKQLHAAVATWLSVFKFRTFNVDQSVYPSCSHATESRVVSQSLFHGKVTVYAAALPETRG